MTAVAFKSNRYDSKARDQQGQVPTIGGRGGESGSAMTSLESASARHRRRLWVGLIGGGILASAAAVLGYNVISAQRSLPADPTDARQVAQGRSVYEARCAACHGRNLEGQAGWQRRLPTGEFPAPPHDESGHTWHHSDKALFRMTKQGIQEAPPGPKSSMPAFSDVLSDAEIWAALAYIKSRWPEPIRSRQAEIDRLDLNR